MIIGSGIDIVDIPRLKRAIEKWEDGFLTRVFTNREVVYSRTKKNSFQHLAVRFAAKEAIVKALGNGGLRFVRWKDIEILNDNTGRPGVELHGYYRHLQKERKISEVLVSMSHAKDYALASVVLVSDEE